VSCGYDFKSGRVVPTVVDDPGSADREPTVEHDFGFGPSGLVARAAYSLLRDSGSTSSVRVQGLHYMAVGFITLVAWVGIVSALAYFVIPDASKAAPAPAAAPAANVFAQRNVPPPGFGWLLVLVFFPAVWSTLKIQIGLFQVVSGIRFAAFYDWMEHSQDMRKLLLVPVIVVVVVPGVVVTLVGTLVVCGYLFRLVTG
jgi:hypothetical protein